MRLSFPVQFVILGLAALVVVSVVTAFAAGITVSPANAGQESMSVTINDLKPSACAGLSLEQMVSGSGTLTGTSGNDLILGSSGVDVIDGLGGDDCILGGGSDDSLTGNDGSDVCLGGPGDDVFITCEGESQ
jgi:Ca2+-binding RTX toxin-like protein